MDYQIHTNRNGPIGRRYLLRTAKKNGIRVSILLGTITFYPFTAKVLLCCFAVVPLSAYLNDSCQRLTFDISFCNRTCPLFQIQYLVPGIRRILFEISWHTYNTSLAREATVATRWTTIRASPTACKVQGVLQTRQCLKKYPVKFGAVPYHTKGMYCTSKYILLNQTKQTHFIFQQKIEINRRYCVYITKTVRKRQPGS